MRHNEPGLWYTLQEMHAWFKVIRCSFKVYTLSRVIGDGIRIGWSYGLHKQNKRKLFWRPPPVKIWWGWWLVPIMASNRGQCTMFTFWLAYQSYAKMSARHDQHHSLVSTFFFDFPTLWHHDFQGTHWRWSCSHWFATHTYTLNESYVLM